MVASSTMANDIRVLLCSVSGCVCQHVTDADDHVVFLICEGLRFGHSLRPCWTQVVYGHAEILACALHAFPCSLVERTIVNTAHIGNQADFLNRMRPSLLRIRSPRYYYFSVVLVLEPPHATRDIHIAAAILRAVILLFILSSIITLFCGLK